MCKYVYIVGVWCVLSLIFIQKFVRIGFVFYRNDKWRNYERDT
jgi:hypothetical protein